MKRMNVARQIALGSPGGDFWNPTSIAFAAKRQGAVAVEYAHLTTGLWLTCTLIMADGSRHEDVRLYS